MEIIFIIYLFIGTIKIVKMCINEIPSRRPVWFIAEKNPIKVAVMFFISVLLWPIIK